MPVPAVASNLQVGSNGNSQPEHLSDADTSSGSSGGEEEKTSGDLAAEEAINDDEVKSGDVSKDISESTPVIVVAELPVIQVT